jgi:RimJ/RimL family protein N-acetyltransferase
MEQRRPYLTPVLETHRLILRGHRESDLDSCAEMWSDPEVVRYIGGRPFSPEEVWVKLLRYVGHWELKGFGYWIIEEKESGRIAGEIGFADFKRTMVPSLGPAPELGWVLASWAHGKGYATEAARQAIEWSEANLESERTVCLIHPENAASIRLATKCGFREFQTATYKRTPTVLFERFRLLS